MSDIHLYRGMSKEDYNVILLERGLYCPNPNNIHNDCTTNLETAQYYASEKVREEKGVVISFTIDQKLVRQDEIYTEDYKILGPTFLKNLVVCNV